MFKSFQLTKVFQILTKRNHLWVNHLKKIVTNWQRNALLLRSLILLVDVKLIPVWQTQKHNKSGGSEREPRTERMNYMQKTPIMEINNLAR